MAINPKTVFSPKKRLKNLRVIVINSMWSVALRTWDGNRAMLIRWNGDTDHRLGNPASHGWPTWFVLPEEFLDCALSQATPLNARNARGWLNGGEPTDWDEVADGNTYDNDISAVENENALGTDGK